MKYEIQNSDSIDFINEKPLLKIGAREFYKCKYKKESLTKKSSLNNTDLYYITKNHQENNDGAYLAITFDDSKENIMFFEYLRKPDEDIESVEYLSLEFVKRMNYDIKKFKKSDSGFKYFNVNS